VLINICLWMTGMDNMNNIKLMKMRPALFV
jgi:hypothetical protein